MFKTPPPSEHTHFLVLPTQNCSGGLHVQVNVLDEVYNPNLREAIKTYSQWPTIPQVIFAEGRPISLLIVLWTMILLEGEGWLHELLYLR